MTPIQAYRSWFYPRTLRPDHIRTAKVRNLISVFGAIPVGIAINALLEQGLGKNILLYGLFILQMFCIMRITRISVISTAVTQLADLLSAISDEKNTQLHMYHQEGDDGTPKLMDPEEVLEIPAKELGQIAIDGGRKAVTAAFTQLLKTFHDETSCTECRGRNRHADDESDDAGEPKDGE